MDANQLLYYLRGFFELVPEPTPDQVRALRTQILQAGEVRVIIGKVGDCAGCGDQK